MNEPIRNDPVDLQFHAMLWVKTRNLSRLKRESYPLSYMVAKNKAQYYCVVFSWMMDNKRRINHG